MSKNMGDAGGTVVFLWVIFALGVFVGYIFGSGDVLKSACEKLHGKASVILDDKCYRREPDGSLSPGFKRLEKKD